MSRKRLHALILGIIMLCGAGFCPARVQAASGNGTPFVSLGADLSPEQKETVLSLLGITDADLEASTVLTVTNRDEHDMLGDYLDDSVIGRKAYSSAMIIGREEGYGIQVTTKNINYCTPEMYQNALATAGVRNADVIAVGPFELSGTAALVGATKAYSAMKNAPLKAERVDAAANELVATTLIAESIGDPLQAAELIAAIKAEVVEGRLTDEESINQIIDQAASELNIKLTDNDRKLICTLMEKIGGLNLDFEEIRKQASDIYDTLKSKGFDISISKEQAIGILDRILQWLKGLWEQIRQLLS